jgi:hypothetical protein
MSGGRTVAFARWRFHPDVMEAVDGVFAAHYIAS